MSGDEWCTPNWLFEWLDRQYNFVLDAACTKENCKCVKGISKELNALVTEWFDEKHPLQIGNVFLNPPYSRKAGPLLAWCKKGFEQAAKWGVKVVAVIPADLSTQYARYIFGFEYEYGRAPGHARKVWCTSRIQFVGASQNAKFASMVIEFDGNRYDRPELSIIHKDIIKYQTWQNKDLKKAQSA
jgi:phage N-6-adenine-methyltransferase